MQLLIEITWDIILIANCLEALQHVKFSILLSRILGTTGKIAGRQDKYTFRSEILIRYW